MADGERLFDYVAVDASGRRVKGAVAAADDSAVFERLKRDGLSPIQIRTAAKDSASAPRRGPPLSDRDVAGFLADLAALLRAGADMRAALAILGARGEGDAALQLARGLSADIGGGGAIEAAFSSRLPRGQDFIAALIAAGEASGDLAGGLERAAEMMGARLKLRDQLVSILSYPAFVFASTVAAVAVILLFVVPSLAPLVEDTGGPPPLTLAILIAASTAVRSNLVWIGGVAASATIGLLVVGRAHLLRRPFDRFLLDGPMRRTARAIVYGGYAVALGNVLAGGAPMNEALRLAARSVRSVIARERLEPMGQAVREGQGLSDALDRVKGFPTTITRLAAVGEASGALGAMIARGGRLEEERAIRRIEAVGRILGPALIVALGGLIGLLMAGLLTGVTQLGQLSLD